MTDTGSLSPFPSGVVLPEPTYCQRDSEDGPCTRQMTVCTCNWQVGCSEDEAGCCYCTHMDPYSPCPTFGFGCGPGCDCCTPFQQRQTFLSMQPRHAPSATERGR